MVAANQKPAMSLFAELKRRNVLRVAVAYVVAAWLVIQVVETIFPAFGFGDAAVRVVTIVFTIGLVPMLLFAWAFELTPEGLKREKDVSLSQSISPQTGKKLDRMITVVLALALGYFAFDKFVLSESREAFIAEQARQEGRSEALVESYGDKSIAVLPFENRSGDPGQEYFSDGLTDELTSTLARIAALKVIARTSSASFKGSDKRASAIGEELGVATLLTGSVLRADGRVRITAELIDTTTEGTLWAQRYERAEHDIFSLQAEVASAIANAIEVRLSPAERQRLASASQVEPSAFEEYLRGRSRWKQRTEPEVRVALEHFRTATIIQPNFALGHAGMADALIILGVWGFDPPAEAFPAARRAALRAIEIDPGAGEPHASLGDILFHYDWDWPASAAALDRAIELAPNFATAYHWSYEPLVLMGDPKAALAQLRKASALDPLFMTVRAGLAEVLALLGQQEAALAELHDALELDPNHPHTRRQLARQLLIAGQPEEALRVARHLVAANPNAVPGLAVLGLCLAVAGNTNEAESVLAALEKRAQSQFVSALDRARITAGLGDAGRTLAYLEQAIAAREGFVPMLAVDHEFDFLRTDPRFGILLQQAGIQML